MKHLLFLFFILIVLSSCSSQKPLQRYHSIELSPRPNNLVTDGIQVFATAREASQAPSNPSSPYVLSDHGQAAYISALALMIKDKDIDAFQDNLFPDLSDLDKVPSQIDNTVFTKRLLLTLVSNTPYEADRITKVNIRIPLNSNITSLKILNWDKITTDFETIDLGTINQANSLTLAGNLGYSQTGPSSSIVGASSSNTINNPNGSTVNTSPVTNSGLTGPSLGAGLNGSYSNTTTSQVNYKNRYIALTGYFRNDSLEFDEQSVLGVNLAGNILSDIKFTFQRRSSLTTYLVSNLRKGGKILGLDKISIKQIPVFEPSLPDDLQLPIDYIFTVRHVLNEDGKKTVPEYDDDIAYYTVQKRVNANLTLVSKQEMTVRKWTIRDKSNTLRIKDKYLGTSGYMFFASLDNAKAFLRWLKQIPLDKNGHLSTTDYEFTEDTGHLKAFIDSATVSLEN